MKGRPPLQLFTIPARDPRLLSRCFAGGLLDKGDVTLRQREIVILRTTALCGSEYEWGVHVSMFAADAGLGEEQIRSTVGASDDAACWSKKDLLLNRLCDDLHATFDINDGLWVELRAALSESALLGLLLLAGF